MAVFLQGCPRELEGLVKGGGAAVWGVSCGEMGCAAFAFASPGCPSSVTLESGETYMRYSLLIGSKKILFSF